MHVLALRVELLKPADGVVLDSEHAGDVEQKLRRRFDQASLFEVADRLGRRVGVVRKVRQRETPGVSALAKMGAQQRGPSTWLSHGRSLSAREPWFQVQISRFVRWSNFKGRRLVLFGQKTAWLRVHCSAKMVVMPEEETDRNRGETVRDAQGRFTGAAPGPGRPASWSTLIRRALTNDVRRKIVQAAVDRACEGCPESRAWLLRGQDWELAGVMAEGLSKATRAVLGSGGRRKSGPLLSEASSPPDLARRPDGALDVEALRAQGFSDWDKLSLDDWLSIRTGD